MGSAFTRVRVSSLWLCQGQCIQRPDRTGSRRVSPEPLHVAARANRKGQPVAFDVFGGAHLPQCSLCLDVRMLLIELGVNQPDALIKL